MQRQRTAPIRVASLLLLAAIVIAVAAVSRSCLPTVCYHPAPNSRTDAQALASAARLYLTDQEPPKSCPKAEDLKRELYLDGSRGTTDAWGTPFRIACSGGDVAVISAGPDLMFGTDDDIDASARP